MIYKNAEDLVAEIEEKLDELKREYFILGYTYRYRMYRKEDKLQQESLWLKAEEIRKVIKTYDPNWVVWGRKIWGWNKDDEM